MNDDIKEYKPRKNIKHKEDSENQHTVVFENNKINVQFDNFQNKQPIIQNINLDKKDEKLDKKMEKLRIKKKSKSNKNFFKIVWIIMIFLVSATLIKYVLVGMNDMLAITRNSENEDIVVLELPANANVYKVADCLKAANVINDKSFFQMYVILTKSSKKFTQGIFEIKKGLDYEAIIDYLQTESNRTDTLNVTFPEGKNILEYANILLEKGVCEYNDFLETCNSNEFDKDYSFLSEISNSSERKYKLEGYLFPDTYTFYYGEKPRNVIKRFLNNSNVKLIDKKSDSKSDQKISIENMGQEKNMSLDEILNIASLIQAESSNNDDMYYVSSVIHNRLNISKDTHVNKYREYGLDKLELDATVWYPYRTKSEVPENSLGNFQGEYDTYNIEGLPAGPICNPGLDAINAALNPKDTNYYYFCHSDDGTSYYAKTKEEHKKNLSKAGLK